MKSDDYQRRLFTPSFISEILKKRGLALHDRFGQNFLINRGIAERIVGYSGVSFDDTVLEIGPGLGTLTFLLASKAQRVIAVEIDGGFARYLEETAGELGFDNVVVLNRDFLGVEGNLIAAVTRAVSSFPYSIGIRAILKIVHEAPEVRSVTGLVQREMAERVTADPGSKGYAAVSVILQYLAEVRVIEKRIVPSNFFPAPEVVSAILEARPRRGELPVPRDTFERVVRAGFGRRRKSLAGNLAGSFHSLEKEALNEILERRFGNAKVRAERLAVEDFVWLSTRLDGV